MVNKFIKGEKYMSITENHFRNIGDVFIAISDTSSKKIYYKTRNNLIKSNSNFSQWKRYIDNNLILNVII